MADYEVPLREDDASDDPLEQFRRWFAEARELVRIPEAVALASVGLEGRPSLRIVLMKSADERGFTFFTDYHSRKGRELQARPVAALCFYWDPLGRQVRVEGPVEQVSAGESDDYFATRPKGSQISAAASSQSVPVAGRGELEARYEAVAARFEGLPVPRPDHWGGFRIVPTCYEFWQNRSDRLHDRLRYRLDGPGWVRDRLQP